MCVRKNGCIAPAATPVSVLKYNKVAQKTCCQTSDKFIYSQLGDNSFDSKYILLTSIHSIIIFIPGVNMGNLLVAPITDKETHRGVSEDGIEYGVSSMQGWRVHMEDAHICETVLFAEQLKNDPQTCQEISNDDNNQNENGDEIEEDNNEISISSNDESATDSKRAKTNGDVQTDDTVSVQEYTQIELKGHCLFAVFDGHGGTFAAEYAGLNFKRVLSRQPALVEYANFLQEATGKDDSHDDNVVSPHAKAQFNRQGLELLEKALKDAFLDIDREIWRWINGKTCGPDCILPSKKQDDEDEHLDNNDEKMGEDYDSDAELDVEEQRRILESEDDIWRSQQDAGTTATVVILTPTLILCANAGDSRAVYSKNGHSTIPLSYDHKPDDEAEERRIYEAGGFVRGSRVEGDLAVSRGLGDFRFKESALYEAMGMNPVSFSNYGNENGRKRKGTMGNVDSPQDQKVSPLPDIVVQNRNPDLDEFIVIACDGIFDVQTNHECISMTAEIFQDGERDLGLVCEEILDMCLDKGSKDNMTALVIKFQAMVVGEGGGVEERRRRRKEKEDECEEYAS